MLAFISLNMWRVYWVNTMTRLWPVTLNTHVTRLTVKCFLPFNAVKHVWHLTFTKFPSVVGLDDTLQQLYELRGRKGMAKWPAVGIRSWYKWLVQAPAGELLVPTYLWYTCSQNETTSVIGWERLFTLWHQPITDVVLYQLLVTENGNSSFQSPLAGTSTVLVPAAG